MAQHGRKTTHQTVAEHLLDTARSVTPPSDIGECARALKKLEQVVLDGLRHGFFECTVVCEIITSQKRRLVIKAGVSHRFVIPPEELDAL